MAVLALALAAPLALAHDGHGPGRAAATGRLEVALVSSELRTGLNRVAFGLFDEHGAHIQDAVVHLHYFDLTDPNSPGLEAEVDATLLTTPDGLTTLFAHERSFPWSGLWGLEIQALLPDGSLAVRGIALQVQEDGPSPAPGEAAPRIATPTPIDVGGDLALVTSAPHPNPELYRTSLADSLASDRPTVVLFATPAFCRTRFCGPTYEALGQLAEHHADGIDFIHVEVFAGLPNPAASGWPVAPAMRVFGLTTEPWLFLIDRDGIVRYRIEGYFAPYEVEPHLYTLLER